MIFKEFGDKSKPAIIMLHGGGLSWWSLKPQIEALQKKYYVITPILDGHGEEWHTTFVSIQKSATCLHEKIKGSTLKVIEKSGHGEISLVQSDKHLEILALFFEHHKGLSESQNSGLDS